MRIVTYLGTTREDVESKKFNIWVGVSLGNRYFTKENIKEYILWALDNTKKDVLVVIADRISSINFEVMQKHNKLRAYQTALRKGDEKEMEIDEIVAELPEEKRKLVKIARWYQVTSTKYYQYRLEVLREEFAKKKEFYSFIISIVKDNYKNSPHRLTQERLEKLSEYVLQEIPVFVNGVTNEGYFGLKTPKNYDYRHNLIIYPGLNKLDELLIGLRDGKMFSELAKKLYIKERFAIIEGYVN